jgi:fumarate reductase subunit D
VALAVFLPFHFLALGLALDNGNGLDRFLAFAELPFVKVAEWGLVMFLSIHLFFGIRLLIVEFLPWRSALDDRADLVGWGVGGAVIVGLLFIAGAF